MAPARFFACVVTPAPDTLTCVPVVCWFAQKSATGKFGSLAMQPREVVASW